MKQTKYIFAAALAMLALGCNKEQVAVDGTPDGEKVAVTFTAELPGTITKAIGDGLTAKNLSVAVYDDASNAAGTHIVALDKTAVFDALHTTVEYSLVKGKTYHSSSGHRQRALHTPSILRPRKLQSTIRAQQTTRNATLSTP